MNKPPDSPPDKSERDMSWMDSTYPLDTALIDKAILELGAQDAGALTRPEEPSAPDTKQERVTGPFEGFFIASYGCCIGGLGNEYIGSFKICETRPVSYWDARAKFIGWCSHTEPTSLAAMELAEGTAQERILDTFLSPGPAQRTGRGAATDIFPPSYWSARRRSARI